MKIHLLLSVSILLTFNSLSAQIPSVLWHFDTHDMSFGNAAMADLDNDGKPEIVFSCYWNDSFIYVLNAEDGSLLWKHNMGGCNDAAPVIYDVDSDGVKDVILGSSCNPVLTCFSGDSGHIKWQVPFGGTDSPLSIADIDGDGQADLLTGDFAGHLDCYNPRNGVLKWQITVDSNSAIEASPALVDVNNDGHPDIIVNTWSYGGNGDSTAIYAYDGMTHSLIWKNGLPKDVIYHGAAFADVDEDGKPELSISCYDANVYLLNGEDGSLNWKYEAGDSAYVGDPVTIGDLDNDGHLELVYISGYGEVTALDRFGNLKWTYMLPLYESAFRGAVLADINNDDTLDVIFATTNGVLYALNGSRGNLIWSMDLRADYDSSNFGLEHGPLVADFNNDDTLDIFVVGGHAEYPAIQNNYGRAYAIKAGKGHGPDWTMFQHDVTRSNCLCTNNAVTSIPEVAPAGLAVSGYPNPFSQNVNFNISLTGSAEVAVVVFNMQGETVKTFSNKELSEGNYQFTWNGTSDSGTVLSSGIYYCQVTAGKICTTKKLVLVR